MAVVTDWQTPLEEALINVLNSRELSAATLNEAHRILSLLDSSSDGIPRIRTLLEEKTKELEDDYQEAVKNIETGTSQHFVQQGIDTLKRIGNYKESTAKINLGEDRLRQQAEEKRRQEEEQACHLRKIKLISICTAVAVIIVIAGYLKNDKDQNQRRILEMKAQVQSMIDQDSPREIIPLLKTLDENGVPAEEIYILSEAALEHVAWHDSFAAAFDWETELEKTVPSTVSSDRFYAWAYQQLSNGCLPVNEGWYVATYGMNNGRLKTTDTGVLSAYNSCLNDATSKAELYADTDMKKWVRTFRPYFTEISADPETALRLCYALEHAGYNLAELFPDGIAINVPVGASVSTFTTTTGNSNLIPDMTRSLPVSIIERTHNSSEIPMFQYSYTNLNALEQDIQKLQAEDSHYSVMLLPQYLKAIPEEVRAENFSQCTCLVAMQQTYLLCGYTYTTNQYGNSRRTYNKYLSTYTTNYRGHFDAVISTVFYDMREPDHYVLINAQKSEPIISAEGWYDKHKNDKYSNLYTAENTLGVHDTKKLRTNYEDVINNLELYQLLIRIQNNEESEQSIQETATPAELVSGGDER